MEHRLRRIFVAEGGLVVRRLLESNVEVVSMLLTSEWLSRIETSLVSRGEAIEVFVAPKSALESIVGYNLHQGIMAVGRVPGDPDIDLVLAKAKRPYLLSAIDGLTSSENVGVVVRNCAAFGVHALLVGETSSSPYLRRAVRNSMGAVFSLPVIHAENLAASLESLRKRRGIDGVAAHPHADEAELSSTDLGGDCCLVFGSEGAGVSTAVLNACARHAAIPMRNGVDSLNVASASAVFLYEASRQRARRKS
jgi:tRNA G18 (ribose-2'-O)-methylase SpoU